MKISSLMHLHEILSEIFKSKVYFAKETSLPCSIFEEPSYVIIETDSFEIGSLFIHLDIFEDEYSFLEYFFKMLKNNVSDFYNQLKSEKYYYFLN